MRFPLKRSHKQVDAIWASAESPHANGANLLVAMNQPTFG
jgi:hypothetical protein